MFVAEGSSSLLSFRKQRLLSETGNGQLHSSEETSAVEATGNTKLVETTKYLPLFDEIINRLERLFDEYTKLY